MAAQNLPPTSIAVQTNLSGSVTDIDESPDSPDGLWLTASGSSILRVLFDTPTLTPEGTQKFRAWVRRTNIGTYSETLYPDAVGSTTNYNTSTGSSALDCINEDQNAFGTSYWFDTADDPSASGITFPTPTVDGTLSNPQTIGVYCGKQDPAGSLDLNAGGSDPTITISVYSNGGLIAGSGPVSVTTIGQWVNVTFDPADLVNPDGSDVSISFTTTNNGGGPNERSVAVDSIRWQATSTAGPVGYNVDLYEDASKTADVGTGTITSTTGQLISHNFQNSQLVTADGSAVELYLSQTSGSEFLEIGAVEWQSASDMKATLYLGNDTNGVSLVYTSPPGPAPLTNLGFKEVYSEDPTIVPNTTENARVGLGHTASNTGTAECQGLLVMVLDAPNAGYNIHSAVGIVYNPVHRLMPHLVR